MYGLGQDDIGTCDFCESEQNQWPVDELTPHKSGDDVFICNECLRGSSQ